MTLSPPGSKINSAEHYTKEGPIYGPSYRILELQARTPQQRQAIGQEVVEKLTALKGKVPVLKDISVFCPPMDSSSCDLVLYSEVEQESDLPLYQNHPEHQAILPLIRDNFCDRRCCDIQG